MKPSFLYFLLLIVFSANSIFAQEIKTKISFSQAPKLSFSDTYYYTFQNVDSSLVVIYVSQEANKKGQSSLYIHEYSTVLSSMNTIESEIIGGNVFSVFQKGNVIGIFHKKVDKKKNIHEYFVSTAVVGTYNFKTKKFFSIDDNEIDKQRFVALYSDSDDAIVDKIQFSRDKNHFSLSFDGKSKASEKILFFVFNSNFEKIYGQEFTKDIKDRKYDIINYILNDENQNIYLLAKNYDMEQSREYEITQISKEGTSSRVIDSGEFNIESLDIFTNGEDMYLFGHYTADDSWRRFGSIYERFDARAKTLEKTYSPYPKSFIQKRFGHDRFEGLGRFVYKGHKNYNDGGIVYGGEDVDIYPSAGVKNKNNYDFLDILIFKLDTEGNFLWGKKINKKQSAGFNSVFHSYKLFYQDKYIYCFTNSVKVSGEGENLKFSGNNKNKQSLYVIRFDQEGNYDYKKIIDNEDLDYPLMIRGAFNKGNAYYFRGWDRKKHQFIKVEIE